MLASLAASWYRHRRSAIQIIVATQPTYHRAIAPQCHLLLGLLLDLVGGEVGLAPGLDDLLGLVVEAPVDHPAEVAVEEENVLIAVVSHVHDPILVLELLQLPEAVLFQDWQGLVKNYPVIGRQLMYHRTRRYSLIVACLPMMLGIMREVLDVQIHIYFTDGFVTQ